MGTKISMHLAEKMIRLEQSSIASMHNKHVHYNQTEYFKSMNLTDRKRFETYLKSKKRLPLLFGIAIILPLIAYALTKISFTGNIIMENVANPIIGNLGIFFLSIFFISVILFIYYRASNKNIDNSFTKNSKIMDNFIL
ncbi:MAG: hypothetical protein Q8L27_03250, partial [archaeon]|nr:hypothetical protein [archaeon]